MITPEEAKELMSGSLKYKNVFFKTKLNWICGRLNHEIATQAANGMCSVTMETPYKDVASKYYPVMAKTYEAEGYYVAYTTIKIASKNPFFIVCWDPLKLTHYQESGFVQAEYHTPLGEITFGRCTNQQISETINVLKEIIPCLPSLPEYQKRAISAAIEIAKTAHEVVSGRNNVFSDRVKNTGATRHYDLLEKV